MDDDIKTMFWKSVSEAIDAEGVYPHHMIIVDKDNKIIFCALDLDVKSVLIQALKAIMEECKELIFGLDRATKDGQGTEFADVLTCAHWKDGVWTIGVINYQHEPRIVREWDWNNEFWKAQMLREIAAMERAANVLHKIMKSTPKNCETSRPEIDPAKLRKWEENYAHYVEENGAESDFMKEIFLSGDWLADQLSDLGVGKELSDKLCFVHGQRSFANNPWESATKVLADYKNGKIEKPGAELAEKITKEWLGGFTTPVSEV